MTTALWTAKDAAKATGGKATGTWEAASVCIDTRKLEPGALFIAIKGERMDGHDFVAQALAAGAAAAVVSRVPEGLPDKAPLLVVQDTVEALKDLARFARKRCKAQYLAVTGSVGKTGTKEMLKIALSALGKVYASEGNLNNQLGVPLSLARMPQDANFGVFELGMNHKGEIAALTQQVKPDVAIITSIEATHLEHFGSVEDIARAKAEIFEGVSRRGAVVLPADNAYFPLLQHMATESGITRIFGFGFEPGSRSRVISSVPVEGGVDIEALIDKKTIRYTMKAAGRHWIANSLAVLSAVRALKLDVERAAKELLRFTEPAGRGKIYRLEGPTGQFSLIDDSYNASPASMRAAFGTLQQVHGDGEGRRIAVLGDMLELGSQSQALHAELAASIADAHIDMVFTVGTLMEHLFNALPVARRGLHFRSSGEVGKALLPELRGGDTVLLKGSHGSRMYEVVEFLLKETNALPRSPELRHAV
ncbi:MAG: UDP-N-acetylmuramoyl-tripeptide--D-alanyl-D-alanine ligase [Alphaproteobacteria bacterium]|nr:UDP-N-acetylmuramoyl-tripeptide--D-alanyl-D-alanine ligase [Alphaproteobacteria bacterium]